MIKGLSKIQKAQIRPSIKIDLSMFTNGEECFIELSEPTAASLFPDADALKQLKIRNPKFPEGMLYQIILLAKSYVIQPEDGDSVNAFDSFSQLAKDNKDAFYHLLNEYLNAFPTGNFEERVKDAGED